MKKKINLFTDFNSDSNDSGVSTDFTKFKKLIGDICKEHHCQNCNRVCIILPPKIHHTFIMKELSIWAKMIVRDCFPILL